MMADEYPEMPCGHCDAGTYSATPVLNGLAMFGDCTTRKEALSAAPRCKHDAGHICWGARDWIIGMTFPMSAADKAQILADVHR